MTFHIFKNIAFTHSNINLDIKCTQIGQGIMMKVSSKEEEMTAHS